MRFLNIDRLACVKCYIDYEINVVGPNVIFKHPNKIEMFSDCEDAGLEISRPTAWYYQEV